MSFSARFATPLAATAGYLVGAAIAMLAGWALETERRAGEQARFAAALAEQLAAGAEEPLLRQDRVSLGVAANRVAARAEVRQVAIHTMDGRPFVVAGEPPRPGAPVFVQPVALAGEAVAEVRLALNDEAFATSLARSLAIAWPFWAVGLAITLAISLFGGRVFAWWRGAAQAPDAATAAPPSPETAEPASGAIVVVANLFVDAATLQGARFDALAAAANLADGVAQVYGAHATPLPGTGCALMFRDDADADQPFNAVCAVLLLRRLLERWQASAAAPGEEVRAEHPFRYAANHFASAVPAPVDLPGSEAASEVLLLSSCVRNGEVVIGETALDAVAAPERLLVERFDNPAAAALTDTAKPAGLVRGVVEEYESVLDAQAAEIGAAFGLPSA